MKKKHILLVAGFLLALDIFAWKEVFISAAVLANPHFN